VGKVLSSDNHVFAGVQPHWHEVVGQGVALWSVIGWLDGWRLYAAKYSVHAASKVKYSRSGWLAQVVQKNW
jgi:hypothetical protein